VLHQRDFILKEKMLIWTNIWITGFVQN
jgi:hypothetical protein